MHNMRPYVAMGDYLCGRENIFKVDPVHGSIQGKFVL